MKEYTLLIFLFPGSLATTQPQHASGYVVFNGVDNASSVTTTAGYTGNENATTYSNSQYYFPYNTGNYYGASSAIPSSVDTTMYNGNACYNSGAVCGNGVYYNTSNTHFPPNTSISAGMNMMPAVHNLGTPHSVSYSQGKY